MKRRSFLLLVVGFFVVTMIVGTVAMPAHAGGRDILAGETPSGIPFHSMEETIDEYVARYIGKTTPGAAVAVVKDGQIVFLKGYGYADWENRIPVDPENTVFEWGSASKLFTWTAVMQLVEEGKLDLDADIKTYLPEAFARQLSYGQPITMRNIMNHAAGFGDYAFNTIVFSPGQVVPLEEAILRDRPQQYYEVGTASAYSNYATSLAGYVVQSVSGKSIEGYMKEWIFDVLLMDNTSADSTLEDNGRLSASKAQGYLPDPRDGFRRGHWSYVSHRPAGSINGTLEDLAKYAIALTPGPRESSPLFGDPNTLDTMMQPSYDPDGGMVGTAHGFFEYDGAYRALGHGGNTAAFTSQFVIVPEERFGIAVLTNAYLEMDILFGVQDLLLGRNRSDITVSGEAMPSSGMVAGRYVPMDRQEGNFVDFAKYIQLYEVKPLDEDRITMNIGAFQGTYLQTGPYYYELIEDNTPIFRNVYPVLRFAVENGTVRQVVVGNGMDLSPLPPGRTMPFLMGSVAVLFAGSVFFLLAPVAMLIALGKNRKKEAGPAEKRCHRSLVALALLGTATLINNAIPVVKIMTSSFRTFAEMRPYILLNYPLLAGAVIAAILTVKTMKGMPAVSKRYRALIYGTMGLLVSLFALLWHWNFFAIVG